ncbi:hypothetical protein [Streptomyces sp. WAC01280]|uniref:hypothetical protein n=1 Tax=Streptomyces sp. WAC01280 TaxID=2487424 RepID=UPI000F776300|nr:hypothetical protein [Streptomyces sp. WAC01280]RSS59833.1 hypothetical protein EF909_08205 [Streptomyces sp. WAC01280]
MSLTLLISSDRLRAVLTRVAHNQLLAFLPLIALGTATYMGWSVPAWLVAVTGPLFLVLFVAWGLGDRLHAELERAGLPCGSCDLVADEEGLA